MYPTYVISDLAKYSGRPVQEYTGDYPDEAIAQATLLFKMSTCLADFPETEDEAQLAKLAILSVADSLILSQPHQATLASPFASENIGSYSYSKLTKAVAEKQATGIAWFDMAVDRLSVCEGDDTGLASGGIEVFEHDGLYVQGDREGNSRLLSPRNFDGLDTYYHDPSQRRYL